MLPYSRLMIAVMLITHLASLRGLLDESSTTHLSNALSTVLSLLTGQEASVSAAKAVAVHVDLRSGRRIRL
jgi:hypothetical protein